MQAQFRPHNHREVNPINPSIWPTPRQEMLLRAALLQGEASQAAWNAWKPTFEDGLDLGSYRLMPLLYHNLQQQRIKDPLLGRLKGIYRRTWVENQILFQRTAGVLTRLMEAGIPSLLLKGSALCHLYYQDFGLRPMNDVDVLVPTRCRDAAIQVLIQASFSPQIDPPKRVTPAYLQVKHAHHFHHPDGMSVDLHWHVLVYDLTPDADDDFWKSAMPVTYQGMACQALNPADMLLHICCHGLHWDVDTSLRWIPDAVTVLRQSAHQMDWNQLVEQAQRHNSSLTLQTALSYLRLNFDAPIPSETLARLRQLPISWQERVDKAINHRRSSLLGYLPQYWSLFLRYGGRNGYRGATGFLKFLQAQKGYESMGEVLRWGLNHSIYRITRRLQGRSDFSIYRKLT